MAGHTPRRSKVCTLPNDSASTRASCAMRSSVTRVSYTVMVAAGQAACAISASDRPTGPAPTTPKLTG